MKPRRRLAAAVRPARKRGMPNAYRLIVVPSVVASLLLVTGCSQSDSDRKTAAPASQPDRNTGVSTSPRSIGVAEREAMLGVLRGETGNSRKVWFAVSPGNPETAALKGELESIFKEAGWEPQTQSVTGMNLKPGLFFMAADETPPDYVGTANKALEASGLPMKTGSGYRAYYEQKTREDPKWAGIALAPEQDYVVVVGPNAPPA